MKRSQSLIESIVGAEKTRKAAIKVRKQVNPVISGGSLRSVQAGSQPHLHRRNRGYYILFRILEGRPIAKTEKNVPRAVVSEAVRRGIPLERIVESYFTWLDALENGAKGDVQQRSDLDEHAASFQRARSLVERASPFDATKPFPGARALGLTTVEAVLVYLYVRYGEKAGLLNKADLKGDDEKLYNALKTYQAEVGSLPFGMASKYTVSRKRFERVVTSGWGSSAKADRQAASRKAKRLENG